MEEFKVEIKEPKEHEILVLCKVPELEIKDGIVSIPKGRYVFPNLEKSLIKMCRCKKEEK
jgi:hypothetical protein